MSTTVPRSTAAPLAGIALLVLPLVALVLKFSSPGWMLILVLVFGGILMVAAYAFSIVMAVKGFFGLNGRFRGDSLRALRARFAAWLHGSSLVLTAFFVLDMGDTDGAYSPFMTLFGLADSELVRSLSDILTTAFLIVAIAAYVWLVVEWILAGRARRRSALTDAV